MGSGRKKRKPTANARSSPTAATPAATPALLPAPSRNRSVRRSFFRFFIACFVVYNLNMRIIASGDSLPARFLPFSILEYGTIWLDPVLEVTKGGHEGVYWFLTAKSGHFASLYPLVTPLLVTPLYVPAVAWVGARGWTDDRLAAVGEVMEKIAASVVASLAAAFFYLLMLRVAPRSALLLGVAFAFGTNTWATSSQALWQHGPAELFVVLALLCLTIPLTPVRVVLAGLACGLLVVNRPPDVCLAAGFGLAVLWIAPRRAALFSAAALVAAAPSLVYNVRAFGYLGGGYSAAQVSASALAVGNPYFTQPMLKGVAGLLVSPGKGLFVFAPFLVFLVAVFRKRFADADSRKLAAALGVGVVIQVLAMGTMDFRAGWCYGPRFMTDAAPILVWMLAPVVESLTGGARRAFAVAVAFAIAVQGVGVFCYPRGASDTLLAVDPWKPANAAFLVEARAGLADPLFFESFLAGIRASRSTR